MNAQVQQWMIKRPGRQGFFEGYSVQGFQYESANADLAWHVTAWANRNPVRNYGVADEKFYGFRVDFAYNARGDSRIEIFPEIENVPAEERKAILKAIAEWEKSGIAIE